MNVKLEPVGDWIIGVAMLHKRAEEIILRPDVAKGSTRCFLIEEVGPAAAGAGYKPGDIVVPKHVYDQLFYGGAYHRAVFLSADIVDRVHAPLNEFVDLRGEPIEPTEQEAAA